MMTIAEVQAGLLQVNNELLSQQLYQAILAQQKYQSRTRLLRSGFKVYSQNDEDGIIQEIFKRIGTTTKVFLEIGVQSGVECNTLKLLHEGWSGVWIEANKKHVQYIKATMGRLAERLTVIEAFVTVENINELVDYDIFNGDQVDLFSLDIDGNDYWVWLALTAIRPRVVVIEYNAMWPPPISVVVPYQADRQWDGSNYFGASLEAMTKLAEDKGYQLVGCNVTGTNAFYVRKDVVGAGKFYEPATAEAHYEPVRYHLSMYRGHLPRLGPWEIV